MPQVYEELEREKRAFAWLKEHLVTMEQQAVVRKQRQWSEYAQGWADAVRLVASYVREAEGVVNV